MLSEREFAKYPFLKSGVKLLESLNLQLDDFSDPNYNKAIDRAAERVIEAIKFGEVSVKLFDPLTELLSFPLAVMFVTLIGHQFLNRRYALAEAVRAYQLLKDEYEGKIMQIALNEFNWDLFSQTETIDNNTYKFKLNFTDYLRTASSFHEPKWKLVNRKLSTGYVSINSIEVVRLLQEEIEDFVIERVSIQSNFTMPTIFQEKLVMIKQVFEEYRKNLGNASLPEQVINDAFPPCMKYCLEGLVSGKRASHMERFGLTSFLVNVGMPIDDVVDLYTSVTDFDESLTRYQIEHIAGLKGNRIKYTPPNCATLRTHGICRNMNTICKQIYHPLSYYRRKVRSRLKTQPLNTSNINTDDQNASRRKTK
jgi:DNA primase large subunit